MLHVTCSRLTDTTKIEIVDANAEKTDEEVTRAISETLERAVELKITSRRNTNRELLVISVIVPTDAANKLITRKLRIVYTYCRVNNRS